LKADQSIIRDATTVTAGEKLAIRVAKGVVAATADGAKK